jgi:hypothetical protein
MANHSPFKYLVAFFFIAACAEPELEADEVRLLSGQWTLENVSGGLLGTNAEVESGVAHWNLNLFNNTLSVTTQLAQDDPDRALLYFEEGVYSFGLEEIEGPFLNTYTFTVDDRIEGTLSLRQGKLEFDSGLAVDKLLYRFRR